MSLTQSIHNQEGCNVTTDNFFTSVYLASRKENFDGRHSEEQLQKAYKIYDQKRLSPAQR